MASDLTERDLGTIAGLALRALDATLAPFRALLALERAAQAQLATLDLPGRLEHHAHTIEQHAHRMPSPVAPYAAPYVAATRELAQHLRAEDAVRLDVIEELEARLTALDAATGVLYRLAASEGPDASTTD